MISENCFYWKYFEFLICLFSYFLHSWKYIITMNHTKKSFLNLLDKPMVEQDNVCWTTLVPIHKYNVHIRKTEICFIQLRKNENLILSEENKFKKLLRNVKNEVGQKCFLICRILLIYLFIWKNFSLKRKKSLAVFQVFIFYLKIK